MDYKLGTRVTFSREAFRIRSDGGKRFWDAPAWQERRPHKEGVVVGVRYLQNGRQEYAKYNPNTFDMDGEDRWVVESTIKAYLVAYDLRKKPVYVFPEHIKPELSEAGDHR